jgi:hypothetical protein
MALSVILVRYRRLIIQSLEFTELGYVFVGRHIEDKGKGICSSLLPKPLATFRNSLKRIGATLVFTV